MNEHGLGLKARALDST
jgi:hypothetical protein